MRRAALLALTAAALVAAGCAPTRAEDSHATSRIQVPGMSTGDAMNRHDTESAAYLAADPF